MPCTLCCWETQIYEHRESDDCLRFLTVHVDRLTASLRTHVFETIELGVNVNRGIVLSASTRPSTRITAMHLAAGHEKLHHQNQPPAGYMTKIIRAGDNALFVTSSKMCCLLN